MNNWGSAIIFIIKMAFAQSAEKTSRKLRKSKSRKGKMLTVISHNSNGEMTVVFHKNNQKYRYYDINQLDYIKIKKLIKKKDFKALKKEIDLLKNYKRLN